MKLDTIAAGPRRNRAFRDTGVHGRPDAEGTPAVSIADGKVRGRVRGEVAEFLGIPYGARS